MGIRINKKLTLQERTVMVCPVCKKEFSEEFCFCSECGQKLKKETVKVYANISTKGISSMSVKTPYGTINTKGKITIPIAKGISYTTKIKGKKKKP